MYEVLHKDSMKSEILPHLSVAKRGYASKSDPVKASQCMFLQVENIFPVGHKEEKVKTTSLCFLCSYVKMDVFIPKHDKMND